MAGKDGLGRGLLANDDDDIVLTENLEAAPAIILGILFFFVALLCFCKDLAPALLRWSKSRKRVIWFYGLIFVASTGAELPLPQAPSLLPLLLRRWLPRVPCCPDVTLCSAFISTLLAQ